MDLYIHLCQNRMELFSRSLLLLECNHHFCLKQNVKKLVVS